MPDYNRNKHNNMYGTKRDNLSRRLNLSQRKKNIQHVGRLLRYLVSVPQFLLPRVYDDDDNDTFYKSIPFCYSAKNANNGSLNLSGETVSRFHCRVHTFVYDNRNTRRSLYTIAIYYYKYTEIVTKV